MWHRGPHALRVTQIWDHAAGAAIVTEAGGCISDARGEPLDFGAGRTLSIHGGIVAAPPKVRAAALRSHAAPRL